MAKRDTISEVVKRVIDAYPIGHEFYGNELKDDVVKLYPESQYAYVDTFLKMARRHRRDSYISIDRNNSLYKRVESNIEKQKRIIRERQEAQINMRQTSAQSPQGFLFAFMFLALFSIYISHNSIKTAVSLSTWTVKIEKISRIQENIFRFSLSLFVIRHDYLGMSSRTNKRQPEKPATELRPIEREGVLYEGTEKFSGMARTKGQS